MSATPQVDSSGSGSSGGGVTSLYRLFESEFFNVWMCLTYLTKYAANPALGPYLCSRLYEFGQAEIEQFIPQLCNLYFVSCPASETALERFIVDSASTSLHLALRLWWLLDATATDPLNPPESCAKAMRLREAIETAAINARSPGLRSPNPSRPETPTRSSAAALPPSSPSSAPTRSRRRSSPPAVALPILCPEMDSEARARALQAQAMETVLAKHRRCRYFGDQVGWAKQLCEVALELRRVGPSRERRQEMLGSVLEQLDCTLREKRVYLPLCCGSEAPHLRVVRMVPSESRVLPSRER
eukprot:RCo039227